MEEWLSIFDDSILGNSALDRLANASYQIVIEGPATGKGCPRTGSCEACHKFVANQVRLELFVLAYNLGNFMRRLALPEAMKHWSLTSLQTRMIKTGGRLVRHAGRLVFQLAGVLVSREMLGGILERIGRLRLAPG